MTTNSYKKTLIEALKEKITNDNSDNNNELIQLSDLFIEREYSQKKL